jgi:transposase
MTKVTKKVDFTGHEIFVGIDVHLKSWNISIYYNGRYLSSFNQPPTTEALVSYLNNSYPNAIYNCAYESGFCGYWIQRELVDKNINCIVVNAADVPQTDKTAKNKTDTNDSKRLAQALQAGLLQANYIPDEELEADRQLVRCNERLNSDLIRSKNRIKGLLYQLGVKLPTQFANNNWSNLFIEWLKELTFKNVSAKITLQHQLNLVMLIRSEKLAVLKNIRALLKKERYANTVRFLMSVPGVGPITAATLLTEIDNMKRFSNFEQLNSYIGYYPSQFSSGENIRQGNIIGRKHNRLRSLLIESAWVAIRTDPAMSKAYNDFKIKVGGKRAIIKIARKILSRIRYVWLNQTIYEKGVIQ